MKVGVLGPAGFTGSYVCVELINRGHEVIGISRQPRTFGEHSQYKPVVGDINQLDLNALAHLFHGLDVLVNAYGPHSAGHEALQYMPFLEVTRKIILAAKIAQVGYFVMVGGCGSLYMPGNSYQCVLENQEWWVAYRRAIADSEAHTVYMEERLGPMGSRLREFRNARIAMQAGKETDESRKVIEDYEATARSNDAALNFIKACRTSFMFFDGNTSFKWTFVSPSALYRPGQRTGSYETRLDILPLKGDQTSAEDLDGRLHGISSADLALAIADEIESPRRAWKHWTPFGDLTDDRPAPSYLTAKDIVRTL